MLVSWILLGCVRILTSIFLGVGLAYFCYIWILFFLKMEERVKISRCSGHGAHNMFFFKKRKNHFASFLFNGAIKRNMDCFDTIRKFINKKSDIVKVFFMMLGIESVRIINRIWILGMNHCVWLNIGDWEFH